MKNKILILLASLSLLFFSYVPVWASPNAAGYDLIEDGANLLTDQEEVDLLYELEAIQEDLGVDVVIVTTYSLDGKSPTAYADDFFDYNGYGQNASKDGILLLVSMEDRDWRISTHGEAIRYFTDAGLDYMSDHFLSYLSSGEYAKCFEVFADLSRDFIVQAVQDRPYDKSNLPKQRHISMMVVLVELVVGFGMAALYCFFEKGKLTSVRQNDAAMDYVRQGSMKMQIQQDRFLHSTVTSRVIERDHGSDGGSSTHTSSSGESHGGTGGKF